MSVRISDENLRRYTSNVKTYIDQLHLSPNFGKGNTATGAFSLVSCYKNTNAATASLLFGRENINNSDGSFSVVGGYNCSNSGQASTIISYTSTNTADYATIFGSSNNNSGNNSILAGRGHQNSHHDSAIFGALNTNLQRYSLLAGHYINNNALGGIAFGFHTNNNSERALVFGSYNVGRNNTLLEAGWGESDTKRKNVFEVYKDGRAKVYGTPTENNDVLRWQEKIALEGNISELNSTKFDKSGGTITGNISVTAGNSVQIDGTLNCEEANISSFKISGISVRTYGQSVNAWGTYKSSVTELTFPAGFLINAGGANYTLSTARTCVIDFFSGTGSIAIYNAKNSSGGTASDTFELFVLHSSKSLHQDVPTVVYVCTNKSTGGVGDICIQPGGSLDSTKKQITGTEQVTNNFLTFNKQ